MKASKLAVALMLAVATNAAVAATDTGRKWYEAGERQLQSQEQIQQLESQGFDQYAD